MTENAPKSIYVDFALTGESTEAEVAPRGVQTWPWHTQGPWDLGGLHPACARPSVWCRQHHLGLVRLC